MTQSFLPKNIFILLVWIIGKQLIKVYPKQAEMIRAMANEQRVICLSCRQSGKCLSSDTIISIKNKKSGKIEEISIGEFFKRFKK